MEKKIIASLFRDRDAAEQAIHEMRDAGVPERAMSVISLHDDNAGDHTRHDDVNRVTMDDGDSKGSGVTKGLATGGAVGAIAGIGALLIPGVGPFIAAGALAETIGAVGSAAVVSGAVGAAAGGLAAALIDYGVDREHADYAEKRVREGGTLITVDTSSDPTAFKPTRAILRASGGEILDERREPTLA